MAVSPNAKFICASDLELYMVDKTTGAPLAAGKVYFYSDVDRITLKSVYQLTGAPPNYSFTELPNPSTLSAVGTFQDALGNNIVPYYYPYEGTPGEGNSAIELYYVKVTDAAGVEQLTREAWPPNVTTDGGDSSLDDEINLIPNGQFLFYNEILSVTHPPIETISGIDIQPIAQGGWFFKRSNGGASVFDNSFSRISGAIASLNDFPRNQFNFKCSTFDPSDSVRDLCITWDNVFKFSAGDPVKTAPYTLAFAGQSNDANTYTVEIFITYNFGTGGSPTATYSETLGTIAITPTYQLFTILINEFDPVGNLGTNDDDYVQISIRGPASSWDFACTDFILLQGDEAASLTYFPTQTDAEMKADGISGFLTTPNHDGSDLYLAPILTQKGMDFDRSVIGRIEFLDALVDSNLRVFTNSQSTVTNLVLADGRAYSTDGYSILGVPWRRLQQIYWDSINNIPVHGTGLNFVLATRFGVTGLGGGIVNFSTNKSGAQTAPADGVSTTGFSFSLIKNGSGSLSFHAFLGSDALNSNYIHILSNTIGLEDISNNAGTSGFVFNDRINTALSYHYVRIQVTALPAAGTYFHITGPGPVEYYFWFTIDGAGADPAPGGTGVLVPLLSTYTTHQAAIIIKEVVAGYQVSNIVCGAGSTLTGGDYFTFNSNSASYAVWYTVDGAGTAPSIANTLIQCDVLGADTGDQVATKTQIAINSHQFAVPNLSDVFFRGCHYSEAQPMPVYDDYGNRFLLVNNTPDDALGSFELPSNLDHTHIIPPLPRILLTGGVTPGFLGSNTGDTVEDWDVLAADSGLIESKPKNFLVAPVIRY